MTATPPWLLAHGRAILFIVLLLAGAGAFAGLKTPVSLFPQVSFPRIVVGVDAGDRPAERMALEVTTPLEQALRAMPGVQHIRSTTSRGSAELSLSFAWNEDMSAAVLRAESVINQSLTQLPSGTTYAVRRMDPTVFPCLAYSLTSATRSLADLRAFAQHHLRPRMIRMEGVAKVEVLGGAITEWQIEVDPVRLQAFGLSADDVATALQRANLLSAVGRLEDHGKLFLVMADAELSTVEQWEEHVIRQGVDGVVRVRDIGRIVQGTVPQWNRVTADGHDAVLIQVYQQPNGNTVAIADAIKGLVANGDIQILAGMTLATWYDQSELITAAAWSVAEAIAMGIGLAALVLMAFLRSITITIIALVAVPTVLLATVLMLHVFGQSFNIMTLGGMAAAVGLIIDDAIVMVEHIVRRIRSAGTIGGGIILREAAAFTKPLAGSSCATIIIFVPLAFMSGVTGAFFQGLSLTMAIALAWSFLVAWIVVPLLAAVLLRPCDADHEEQGAFGSAMHRAYAALMRRLLARPWWVLLVMIPFAWWGWSSYQRVGTGFMPVMDEGGFILDYRAPPGTSLSETDRLLRQVESILHAMPEVDTYSRRTGLQLGGGLTEANQGDFFVRLRHLPRRGADEVMDEVRDQVHAHVPGLDIELLQLMEDLIGDLIATPQPIEVILTSEDGATLASSAPALAEAIKQIPGIVDLNDGVVLAGDAIDLVIDHQAAMREGVDAETIARGMALHLDGQVITRVPQGAEMIGIRIWTPPTARQQTMDLGTIQLRATDGHWVPMTRILTMRPAQGQAQVMHDDLGRALTVTARIDQRDLGSAVHDVAALLAKPGVVPDGVRWRLGGLYEQQQLAFADLAQTVVIAIVLVIVLLVMLYKSFRVALAMTLTTALSLAGVFIGLRLTGTDLNLTALMGLTMVVGIVTEVGIILYSECSLRPSTEPITERLVQAGLSRMRPIAMTILAAIFALTPLALGWGQGSAMQQPLAIAIISGLLVQIPLALIVLPALLVGLRLK